MPICQSHAKAILNCIPCFPRHLFLAVRNCRMASRHALWLLGLAKTSLARPKAIATVMPECHLSTSLWHSETDCQAFKPFSAALASFLHQTLASRLPFATVMPECHLSTSLWHSETDGWHPATPSNASRALWPHSCTTPLCLQVACARHKTLLKPSAALWAGQTATAAPLYGIPKLTDGTLPRLQTLLGSFGLIPAPHPCAFKWRVPAIKLFSNPPRRFGQARLPPQHLFMAFRNWRMAPCHAFKPFSAA